ncbi:GDSL-like Lipase/Acylhydrolase [Rubripirellula amarantea]|uniref:GDSL-like Lipase/Acylhydrolase n=1 Tax=Rubripirellula amarantea TaxID=2527999 RepID=A0A5C5WV75_9BACT|nr:SGNH/GDSL hydrolase family protein [Rubripirellula amarantea]TWT54556.1 GDSL-like Lipase/Acylhydrolase [Rubripirellula amarantea]
MKTFARVFASAIALLLLTAPAVAQEIAVAQKPSVTFGPYEYETKPDDEAFEKFNLRKSPQPGPMLLQEGDRLAIIGDSITEQKMYSRMIETYLTVAYPHLDISTRQFGWSGETAQGLLRRLENDVLRFDPTLATLAYGMNDARYRPYDVTNGRWYRDHYTEIVRQLQNTGARVVVGSPGCAGKIATWVKSRNGTVTEHNLNLAALRDIALDIAVTEDARFADMFWPMLQAQVFAPRNYSTDEHPYEVTGRDGIHPGWAGHVIMAHGFLRAMGIDGDLGTIEIDLEKQTAIADEHHVVKSFSDGICEITSDRIPFCADGPLDRDHSIRSGMTLVPFHEDLNRFVLKVSGLNSDRAKVTWGEQSQEFDADELSKGILLAKEFPKNPFTDMFEAVDHAVADKQAYETVQIKKVFHGPKGQADIEAAVAETESKRAPLVQAIQDARQPVTHTIRIEAM